MGKIQGELRGIPAILRSNAIDLVCFGAIQMQRASNPDESIDKIVQNVLDTFGLNETLSHGAAKTAYFRNIKLFVETGL
jgi:hypothetical protein